MADMKDSIDSIIPAEVSELIEESQKIHGWIQKLAGLRDETTPAVYEKVDADYTARLGDVTSRLAEHQADLSKTLEKRRTGAERLRAERDEQAAELEEAKLRFAVGEYGSEEWDKQRGRIERGLQSLKDRLASEDAALEELEAILASIPGEGEAAPEEREKQPVWMKRDEPGETAPEDAPGAEIEADEAGGDDVAEKDVEETSPGEGRIVAAAEESARSTDGAAESRETRTEEGEYLDELEFLESLSLEEADRFDAVSAMLDEEEGGKGGSE